MFSAAVTLLSGLASVTIFVLSDDVVSGTAITLLTGQLKMSGKLLPRDF